MPKATVVPLREALAKLPSRPGDMEVSVWSASLEETWCAVLMDGDWTSRKKGSVAPSELFPALAKSKRFVAAVVVTGSIDAPELAFIDEEREWAPGLFVGGDLTARALCLGGGYVDVGGDLTLGTVLYGASNDGDLRVGGTTKVPLVLSDDHTMTFGGKVKCPLVLSDRGRLNVAAHHEGAALAKYLVPELLDDHDSPIHERVLEYVKKGKALLRPKKDLGKAPVEVLAKEAKAALAAYRKKRGGILDLGRCNLKRVPHEVRELEGIRVLRLNGNNVSVIPEWLGELPELLSLDIQETAVSAIPPGFSALRELRMGHGFHRPTPEMLAFATALEPERFPKLEYLEVHCNETFDGKTTPFLGGSKSVEFLDLGFTVKRALPACLLQMPKLRGLALCVERKTKQDSLLAVLLELKRLEYLETSFFDPSSELIDAVSRARPGAYLRLTNSDKLGKRPVIDMDAIDSALYEKRYDDARKRIDAGLALLEPGRPYVDADRYERLHDLRLEVLRAVALPSSPGEPLEPRRPRVTAVAKQAEQTLAALGLARDLVPWVDLELLRLVAKCHAFRAWGFLRGLEAGQPGSTEKAREIIAWLEQLAARRPDRMNVAGSNAEALVKLLPPESNAT